ncbi:uncharacterized protein [Haliotis asinina]|uniref:uncharacterized protein n=1 Tax=Haliotis asinina TaxID=109174 RepID=UPI0035322DE1
MAYNMQGGNGTVSLDFIHSISDNDTDPERLLSNVTKHFFRPRELSKLQQIQNELDLVTMPVALSTGIVTNILIVCTFLITPVGRHPLSIYLTAVGLADLTFLLCSMILWISRNVFDIYNHTGMCQLTTYALFLSTFLGTWYLVSAHLERCLWQFGQRRKKKWCTKFRSKCIIITIAIFSMVAYLYLLWTHIVTKISRRVSMCAPMVESIRDLERLRKVEIVFSVFIPMVLIVLMDIILLVKCAANRCFGESTTKPAPRSVRMSTRVSAALVSNGVDLSSESSAATLVCVICGVMYVGLLMPSVYLRAKLSFTSARRPIDFQLMGLFEHLAKLNAVYKFFLYVLFLRSFRKGLVALFTLCCVSRRRRTSSDHGRLCGCCDKSPGGQATDFV